MPKKAGKSKDINQFLALIASSKGNVDKIIDKISGDSELEFIFSSGANNHLNKEKFIYVLRYIGIASERNNDYSLSGPNEMLDISFTIDDSITFRITIHNQPGKDNIKSVLKTLRTKSSNYAILKTALYMAKKKKNTKKFEIITKERSEKNTYDIEEFDLRCKLADELDVYDDVMKESKKLPKIIRKILSGDKLTISEIESVNKGVMYRYKERTSLYFEDNSDSSYIRTDLTYVKSNRRIKRVDSSVARYELEMEIKEKKSSSALKEKIYTFLNKMLKVVQKTNHIVSNSQKTMVVDAYKALMGITDGKVTSLKGRQPVSLEVQHLATILPDQYAVTDKADGDRAFLIITNNQVYLMFSNIDIKNTGVVLDKSVGKKYEGTLLDGEYIYSGKHGRHVFMAFDCLFAKGVDVRIEEKLLNRLKHIDDVVESCFMMKGETGFTFKDLPSSGDFNLDVNSKFYKKQISKFYDALVHDLKIKSSVPLVRRKYFVPVQGGHKWEIYKYSVMFWKLYSEDPDVDFPYSLDGLIYQPLIQKYITKGSTLIDYKWKPENLNSVDFYVEFRRDPNTGKAVSIFDNTGEVEKTNEYDGGELEQNRLYKICNLFVGRRDGKKEKPVPFTENEGSQEAFIFLEDGEARDMDGDMITDKTVVEFYYNNDLSVEAKYRWIPIRTRHDKTDFVERYGIKYGNYITTAQGVWRSIINPVKMSDFVDLARGDIKYNKKIKEINNRVDYDLISKTEKQTAQYYAVNKMCNDFRQFHNFLKSSFIYTHGNKRYKNNERQSVLDFACGEGGDLLKFYYPEVLSYVGLEFDQMNLLNPKKGALARYRSYRKQYARMYQANFIQADLRTKVDYDTQMKALGGNMTPDNEKLLQRFFPTGSKPRLFDMMNCQFAVHYFLENELAWKNFKNTLKTHLRRGGVFMCTCFLGGKVRAKLKGKDNFTAWYTNKEGEKKKLFEIVKKFEDGVPQGVGNAIDVFSGWINQEGSYYTEYLVDKEFFVEELSRDCDFELIDFDTFENQYEMHRDYITKYSQNLGNPKTRQYLAKTAKFYEDNEINRGCLENTKLNGVFVFRKRGISETVSSQKGGGRTFDFSDRDLFYVPNINRSNRDHSFMSSINKVLGEAKVVPGSLKTREMCKDLGLKMYKDYELDSSKVKKIAKSLVIDHEIDYLTSGSDSDDDDNPMKTRTRTENALNGLNVVTVERDCNNHYDIHYVKGVKKGGKYVVLMKEGDNYHPVFDKVHDKGLYERKDDVIQYLIKNGENITP